MVGLGVLVLGSDHASIHGGIAVPHDVGYLVDGLVLHPGDTYLVPPTSPHTLLVPVSGPWVEIGEAIDFIQAVAPRQTIQIHDVMLSDVGRSSTKMFLGDLEIWHDRKRRHSQLGWLTPLEFEANRITTVA